LDIFNEFLLIFKMKRIYLEKNFDSLKNCMRWGWIIQEKSTVRIWTDELEKKEEKEEEFIW